MKTINLLTTILLIISITAISQNTYSQANAGTDQEVCADTTVLSANNPAPEIGHWTVTGGSATFESETMYNTIVRNLSS